MLLRKGLPTGFTATATTTAITVTTTTTAIVITATTATATISTAAAAATTLWTTLFGFIYAEIATLKVGSVHFFNGFTGLFIVCESDESKSAWAVCLTIERDEEVFDCSVSREGFTDVLIRGAKGQIAEIQFHSL
jgi:hypothetical protein